MRPLAALTIGSCALVLLGSASPAAGDGCPLPCSGPSASPPDQKLLFAQPFGEDGPLQVYDTTSGRLRFTLPAGRASADGATFASATATPKGTRIDRFFTASGVRFDSVVVRGRWGLASVSPDGRFIALAHRERGHTAVVLLGAANRVVHRLRLPGRIEVEAIGRVGERLFLIHHLDRSRYRVRTLDLRTELARTVRKRGELAPMTGYAWTAVASRDGRWLLTLYVDTTRRSAFVHALDLVNARPLCIAVPSRGRPTALRRYALKLSPDARTLFAANPALGAVAEVDLGRLRVERITRFRPVKIADPPSRRGATATISRDGRTLYFIAGRTLLALDRGTDTVRGPYPTYGRITALGYGQRDLRVHVLRRDGRLIALNAATGRLIAR